MSSMGRTDQRSFAYAYNMLVRAQIEPRSGLGQIGLLQEVLVTIQVELLASFVEDINQIGPWCDLDLCSLQVAGDHLNMR